MGLASPAFALKKGDKHPEPYKVMTKGKVIGQMDKYLLITYQGEMYRCNDYGIYYQCVLLTPDTG